MTVVAWWRANLPEAEIVPVDTDDVPFALARCRNVGLAARPDDEVVVVADADTLPQVGPLREAVRLLADADRTLVLTARGAEQHAHGTDTVSAWIDLALALGEAGMTAAPVAD